MAQLQSLRALLPVLALVVVGCSGAQPKQSSDENNFEQTPTGPAETPPSSVSSEPEESGGLNTEQKQQMEVALRRGGDKAANCAEVVPDAPMGEGEVKVVFDGQKGRVTDVNVGAPFAGTPVETCIKRSFVGEIIVPFEGEPLEVPYTIKLAKKGAAAPAKDAKDKKK